MKLSRIFALLAVCVCGCTFLFGGIKIYASAYTEGKSECVIELTSGRILYQTRGDLRLPMASTTKIATAATVLRLCDDLQEEVIIPNEAVGVEGSSVYLQAGDRYTVEDLLYGLMLRSGNDCATALALRFGETIDGFSTQMNKTAQAAGALQTRFSNPHGLPSENHYTTARDLSYVTRFAMQNEEFLHIVSTRYYRPKGWKNKNKMLYNYEGAIGVKTGYTKEAGRCLVTAAERDGMTLICTVLSCPSMYERSTELLDGAFDSYKMEELITQGTVLTIENGSQEMKGLVKEDFEYPLSEGEISQMEIKTQLCSSVKNQEIIGQFEIYLSKRLLFSGNLYKL